MCGDFPHAAFVTFTECGLKQMNEVFVNKFREVLIDGREVTIYGA